MIDPMPRRILRIGFVFVCAVLTASCNASKNGMFLEDPKEFEVLIHPDAVDIERGYSLGISNSEEFKTWLAKYTVNLNYPEMAVDEGQRNALYDVGWVSCEDQSYTWERHVVVLQDNSRRCDVLHLSHLVKGNLYVSIVLSYTDQWSEENYNCSKSPTNTSQGVSVTIIENFDVEGLIKRQGLTCGP